MAIISHWSYRSKLVSRGGTYGGYFRMLRRFFFPAAPAAIAVLALLHGVVPMKGQVTTATFYGTITDPSGASVSGANVRLTNQSTGVDILKTTGEGGDFAFNFLQI